MLSQMMSPFITRACKGYNGATAYFVSTWENDGAAIGGYT